MSAERREQSPVDPLLTRAEVCRWLNLSIPTSYRWEREGYLPRGMKLGPGAVRWRRSEIEAFLQRAAEDRRGRVA